MNGFTADDRVSEDGVVTSKSNIPPQQDQAGLSVVFNFGSAHPASFHMLFCDGSVHGISYSIDPDAHRYMGGRDDGRTVDTSGF